MQRIRGTQTATAGKCALAEPYALAMRIAIPADGPPRIHPLAQLHGIMSSDMRLSGIREGGFVHADGYVWYSVAKARQMDVSSTGKRASGARGSDALVERLVRLFREDCGGEARQSTLRSAFGSDLDDVEQLLSVCAAGERESTSTGLVVQSGLASSREEIEACQLVDKWLDPLDAAFGYPRPREFLNCPERRRYFETFVASLGGGIFSCAFATSVGTGVCAARE